MIPNIPAGFKIYIANSALDQWNNASPRIIMIKKEDAFPVFYPILL
jgi:hypothetical protein